MDERDGGSRQAGEQEADPQGEPFLKPAKFQMNEFHERTAPVHCTILINASGQGKPISEKWSVQMGIHK